MYCSLYSATSNFNSMCALDGRIGLLKPGIYLRRPIQQGAGEVVLLAPPEAIETEQNLVVVEVDLFGRVAAALGSLQYQVHKYVCVAPSSGLPINARIFIFLPDLKNTY